MKTKTIIKLFAFLSIILFLISCNNSIIFKPIINKPYFDNSKHREIVLNFISDSTLIIKTEFYCNDIPSRYRFFEIKASYKVDKKDVVFNSNKYKELKAMGIKKLRSRKLFIKSINMDTLIKEIPVINSSQCVFLNKENRNDVRAFDGKLHFSSYSKNGRIPYFEEAILEYSYNFDRYSLSTGFLFKSINDTIPPAGASVPLVPTIIKEINK